jgi:hypothetical protein
MKRLVPTLAGLSMIFVFLGLVVGAAGAGLAVKHNADGWGDVGKALLSLAVGLLVGGAAALVIKLAEQARSERSSWSDHLKTIVEVDETLEVARRLIIAHKTAKTYSEQYSEVVAAKLKLRQVSLAPLVANDHNSESLGRKLSRMMVWMDQLSKEYEDNYLRMGRQQRIDEAYLTARQKEIQQVSAHVADQQGQACGDENNDFYKPTCSWMMLQELPRLREFLDGSAFNNSVFFTNFKEVKPMLEHRAGIPERRITYAPHPI